MNTSVFAYNIRDQYPAVIDYMVDIFTDVITIWTADERFLFWRSVTDPELFEWRVLLSDGTEHNHGTESDLRLAAHRWAEQ